MLNVYFYGRGLEARGSVPSGKSLIQDPDAAFLQIRVSVDSTDTALVKAIDEGQLIDSRTFVDRFGVTLYTSCLSTGCKAALLVNNTDNVVDLRECGINAISAIFSFCRNGNLALPLPGLDLADLSEGAEVAINIKGRVFARVADAYKAMEEGSLW